MIFFEKILFIFSNQVSRKIKTPAHLENPGHYGGLAT